MSSGASSRADFLTGGENIHLNKSCKPCIGDETDCEEQQINTIPGLHVNLEEANSGKDVTFLNKTV